MSRTITIPTTYKLADLEAQMDPTEAKKVFEEIWLRLHPGAASVLRHPLTAEQLNEAGRFVKGQRTGKGKTAFVFAVLKKAVLVDERVKMAMLDYIDEERANLNGTVSVVPEMPVPGYTKLGRRKSKAATEARRRNIAKGRAVMMARRKNGE